MNFLSFTWGDLTSTICEWDLCKSKSRKEKKSKTIFFHILDLKEQTRHCVSSSETSMDAKCKQAKCKRMSKQCERTSERTSEWPSTLRVDFVSFQPRAHRFETFFVSVVERVFHHMGMAFLSLETWCKERNWGLTCSLTTG